MPETAKASLTKPRQRLVTLMQHISFGKIEDLLVRNGDPVFDPSPRVIRSIKLGGKNCPRPEIGLADFVLKAAVLDLFHHLDELGTGSIAAIEVCDGIPIHLRVQETI